ncbi:hypothetical protein [Vibrio genomosp. F10]|uniref:hypothetical protein n=1 Tax=Vibrio genomosp. F10 TaxID=723171 RepID=UPI0003717E48|nr:hypothetical protein [Vibrio genomosp. F10]OEE84656.1 hypothetical protein A1QK_04020 [Vibrio genomosp. F10 str. 9ZD137]OEF04601.1 hypothetical protein A1QI_11080 [Vibrio genomosp. F10 str. 9ZB36]
MCKQASYSKYQKRAIKFLNDLLGTHTPFSYERTQTNHLKVLIDGVPKPIYTGSTPSDCKSINNFMAEVKREIRLAKMDDEKELDNEDQIQVNKPFVLDSNDKLIDTCIKSLRVRIPTMKTQEEVRVLGEVDVNCVKPLRTDAVKHAISIALQNRKQGGYIKPKEMKEIESAILKHVNFMLPTPAYYSELLQGKEKYVKSEPENSNVELGSHSEDAQLSETNAPELLLKDTQQEQPILKTMLRGNSAPLVTKIEPTKETKNSAQQLAVMNSTDRVSLLRGLNKSQALTLIDDINQALALNREQDIESVISLIRDKDLPLEAIISRMEAA